MIVKTVGDLRKIIENLDDDFTLDIRITEEVPKEELVKSRYPYPWRMYDGRMEFQDVGYGDKEVCFGIYESEVRR